MKKHARLSPYDKAVIAFGNPKFKDGDKVLTSLTGNDILTIKGDAWSNGFSWMYYFHENEIGAGQQYISLAKG